MASKGRIDKYRTVVEKHIKSTKYTVSTKTVMKEQCFFVRDDRRGRGETVLSRDKTELSHGVTVLCASDGPSLGDSWVSCNKITLISQHDNYVLKCIDYLRESAGRWSLLNIELSDCHSTWGQLWCKHRCRVDYRWRAHLKDTIHRCVIVWISSSPFHQVACRRDTGYVINTLIYVKLSGVVVNGLVLGFTTEVWYDRRV